MGKRRKLKIEFNEQSRREYLLGFHKRKEIRRKVAKQSLVDKIREQRKAIRNQKRSENKGSNYVFPSHVEELISNVTKETIDLPTHSVTVTSFEDLELAQKDLYLGKNLGLPSMMPEEPEIVVEHSDGTLKNTKTSNDLHFQKFTKPAVPDPKKLKSLERMFKKVRGTKHGRKNPHFKPPTGKTRTTKK